VQQYSVQMRNKNRHKRNRILIAAAMALLSFLPRPLAAQWTDTLNRVMHGTVYPTASFDSRNSFISSQRAHIWGIKAGVEFGSLLQIGLGYNFHDQNLKKTIYFTNEAGHADSATGVLHLAYGSYYIRYTYYKTKRWKFSMMPVQLGIGSSRYTYNDGMTYREASKRSVIVYEPGMSVSYKIFDWIGIGGDVGLRFMLKNNPDIPERFNSPIYSFYTVIYWGDIYKKILPDTKLAKML
jgi:hypothetical protein